MRQNYSAGGCKKGMNKSKRLGASTKGPTIKKSNHKKVTKMLPFFGTPKKHNELGISSRCQNITQQFNSTDLHITISEQVGNLSKKFFF